MSKSAADMCKKMGGNGRKCNLPIKAPNTREAESSKLEARAAVWSLELGIYLVFGVWFLVFQFRDLFGVWDLVFRSHSSSNLRLRSASSSLRALAASSPSA